MSFRILSLDGGGIKGTFAASVLAEFERMTGKRLVEHFDLITGTSTGGIIEVGLGLGLSAADLLKFYSENGPTIFPCTGANRKLGSWEGSLVRGGLKRH
jgi:patatin-like phospholipase/acyl hydrolase